MKLSPEAKQAVKTAIEQLSLLLVDDAMDTVREAASKHWMDAGKSEDEKITISGNCCVEGKLSSESIEDESLERLKKTFLHGAKAIIDEPDEKLSSKVVIEVPTLKFIGGNILEDVQVEIKQLKAQVEQLAIQTSCVLQAPVIRNAVIRNGSPV